MCCCGKAVVNGEFGYSWDGKNFGMHPTMPPELEPTDTIIYDEPGRCGGLDCHSYHFQVINGRYGHELVVRHGGGTERFRLFKTALEPLSRVDSNGRFWLLHEIFWIQSESARIARDNERQTWRRAAAEKRIKTRKLPSQGTVKVWIEPVVTAN